jgi:hypothetical protein
MLMADLLIAVNPDPGSRLPYLLRLPFGGGLVFRTSGTWPRTKAIYCYPAGIEEWPAEPEIVERVPVRSCVGPVRNVSPGANERDQERWGGRVPMTAY